MPLPAAGVAAIRNLSESSFVARPDGTSTEYMSPLMSPK